VRRYLAEGLGTFCLVFTGCGAIVVDALGGGTLGHVGISLVFGLIVSAMIYAVGNVSGAHLNPAVTISFALARRIRARDVPPYVAAQLLGALAAAGLLRAIFPGAATLGATAPADWASAHQALLMEASLTFVLMFVILNVSIGHMEKGIMAGAAVGGTIAMGALLGGPVCGGSMNPARSIAPAVVSGQLADLWIYVVGPIVGAALACPAFWLTQGRLCCPADEKWCDRV